MIETLVSVSDVAERLKVSTQSVRYAVRDGRLRAVRLPGGKKLWLLPSEVLRYSPKPYQERRKLLQNAGLQQDTHPGRG